MTFQKKVIRERTFFEKIILFFVEKLWGIMEKTAYTFVRLIIYFAPLIMYQK